MLSQLITLVLGNILQQHNFIESEKYKYYVPLSSFITAVVSIVFFILQIRNPSVGYHNLCDLCLAKNITFSFGVLSDSLSITISCVVSIIATLSNFYSIGYIKKNTNTFLVYINALSFVMVIFVAAKSLLQSYVALESMVIIIYLMTRSDKKSESIGSAIAFPHKWANVGFIVSMIVIMYTFQSVDFDDINKFSMQNDEQLDVLEFISIFMLLAIFVKTAQFGFSGWLTKSMASSSIPFAAVVLSSTVAPCGILLLIRLQTIFECSEFVQNIMIIVGSFSAVFFATRAMLCFNVNQILVYSTCSQIGLMIIACGFSAYGAAIILFVTHAFSKALLAFVIGSVIHALSGEQNLHNMGGLFELLPKTYALFISATASIICLPLMSSYYAYKVFLGEILNSEMYLVALPPIIATSILTATYLFRMIYKIFHGEKNLDETILAYMNEDNAYMNRVSYIALFFAIFSGVIFYYAAYADEVWRDIFAFSKSRCHPGILLFISTLGIVFATIVCKSVKPIAIQWLHHGRFISKWLHYGGNFISKWLHHMCFISATCTNIGIKLNKVHIFTGKHSVVIGSVCIVLIVFSYLAIRITNLL